MSRIDSGFRRLVAYTVGGVGLLAFVLFLRALFMTQSGSDGDISSAAGDLLGATFFSEEGDEDEPAWSPDGRYLAYVSTRDNRAYLQVRDLTTDTITLIAQDAWNPVWSPDGQYLAYAHRAGNETDLYVTDSAGTSHVKMNDMPNAGSAQWLPDSRSLLFTAPPGEGQIHIVSIDRSSARTIFVRDVWRFSVSDLSPDGSRAIGSGLGRESPNPTGLFSIDLQTEAVSPLPLNDPTASWASWSPDGEYIAYHTRDPMDRNVSILRVVAAQGGEPRTISQLQPGQSAGQHAWSPDSRFVAYLHYASASVLDSGEIVIAWADGSKSVPLLPGLSARTFAWSPDGSQIAVAVKNRGQFDIAIIRADEAALLARLDAPETPIQSGDLFQIRRLTTDLDIEHRPAVSPNGRTVVYASRPDDISNREIYLLDLATGEKRRLTDDLIEDRSPS